MISCRLFGDLSPLIAETVIVRDSVTLNLLLTNKA